MGRLISPSQNLSSRKFASFWRGLALFSLVATLFGCGVRGSEKNPDGTPKGLGVNLVLISGNNQVTKKNKAFALPLIVQVLSPAGTPVPEMDVDFRQVTSTDAQFAVKSMETPKSGMASTTVIGPSAYDEEVQIEARIRNTDEVVIFTLTTTIDVKNVEWVPSNEPPANHTAHHLNPLAAYQVRMRDSDDEIIEVNNKKNWITMSIVEGGQPTLLGDVEEYFTDGIATFSDSRYIKAGSYTLRATHNKSGKYIEQAITIDPGVATQSIAILPGQTHNTGVMTLAEAVTGTVSSLNVDNDFNVTLRAVDDYFNLDPTNGAAVSVQTPNDPTDTEPGASTFASGERSFTVSPVTATNYLVRPVTALTNNDSTTFAMNPGTPTDVMVVLPGQTFNPGQTSFAPVITGSPTQQMAGVTFTAQVIATDAEFNQSTSTAVASVVTSDPSDVHPSSQNLVNGAYGFSVTNVTASSPQTVTPSSGGLNVRVSDNYAVTHNAASQLVYTTQPANPTVAGVELAPVIEIRDAWGNLITTGPDATTNVTLTLQSGSGTLGGTLTKAAVGGVADFTGLSVNIDLIGAKILRATKADTTGSGGTVAITQDSSTFTIIHAPASQIIYTTQPADPTGAGVELAPVVEVRDTFGNLVSTSADATATITLSIQSGTGPLLGGSSMAAVGGVANFTGRNVRIEVTGTKVLRATKADTTGGGGTVSMIRDSNSLDIIHGPADHLTITTQPTDPTVAGSEIAPVVEVRDQFNNVVTTGPDSTANVTLNLQTGTGTLGGTLTKAAVAGVADFTGLGANIDLVGSKVIRLTKVDTTGSGGTTAKLVDTNAFNIVPAPASQLVFTTQPADPTVAGVDLLPVIEIRDVHGNLVTAGADATANVTLSLQTGTGSLGGTLTKAASGGIATFTATEAVDIDLVGTKVLRATKADTTGGGGTGVLTQDSASFDIIHAPASVLVYTTQPADPTIAGVNLLPVIEIRDAFTNVITSGADSTVSLAMTLQTGTGALLGTTSKAAVAGVVTFTATEAMNIQVVGTKTLRATKPDTTGSGGTGVITQDSASFDINHAPANKMVYTTQPADPTIAGNNLLPVIEIRDVYDNVITTGADSNVSVTMSLQSGTGALLGTVSKAASAGIVTFTAGEAMNIQVVGTKTLRATKPDTTGSGGTGVITQDSASFDINHAPANKMVYTTQPSDPTVAGNNLLPVIEIRDVFDNVITAGADSSVSVTMSLQSGSGALLGTVSKAASAGVVTFTATEAMKIQVAGTKTLRATKPDTTGGGGTGVITQDSASFDIVHAPANKMVYTTQPADPTVAGSNLLPVIEIRDVYDNVVLSGADSTVSVTMTLQTGTGSLLGTVSKAAVSGVVTFTAGEAMNIQVVGTKTLRATKPDTTGSGGIGVITQDSASFDIDHAPASQLVYTTQPADPTVAGVDLLPVIEIRDTYNNLITTGADATANMTLSLQSGTGTMNGTLTKAASGGVVTFTAGESVDVDLVGTKVMRASKADTTGGGGTGVITQDSSNFDIVHAPASVLVYTTQPADPTIAGNNLLPVIEIRDAFTNVITSGADSTVSVTMTLQTGTGSLLGTTSKVAVAGVVTFTATEAMNIQVVGTKTLRATKPDTTGSGGTGVITQDSAGFDINHAPANKMVYTTQPADPTVAGNNLLPVIEIRDVHDNVITTGADSNVSVTMSLQSGTGSLLGTVSKAAAAGIVTFTAGEAMNIQVVGTKTLRATKPDTTGSGGTGVITQDSTNVNIIHAPASQLVYTTQPLNPSVAGFEIAPVVEIQDTYGNRVISGADAITTLTFTKQSGPGTLTGTTNKVAAGGVVDMAGLGMKFDLVGSYTFRVTKPDTTGSGGTVSVFQDSLPFNVISGIADRIVYTTPPSDPTTSAVEMPVVLEIQDTLGNRITAGVDSTALVTLSLQSGTGTLGGTVSMNAVAGIADFTGQGVNINLVGSKTLRGTKADTSGSGGTTAKIVDSSAFNVVHAPASQMVFTTQPADPTIAGANLLPVIEIRDAQGNLVTTGADATANVTLSLQSGTGALSGTLTKAASGGIVTFTATEGVYINLVGSKTLRASKADTTGSGGTGVITKDSDPFNINHAAANSLAWTTQPIDPTVAGTDINVAIELRDTFGNVVSTGVDSTANITLTKSAGTGTLGGTLVKALSGGTVSFGAGESVDIDLIGSKTLNASDGTRNTDSNAFTITHAPAASLAWTTQPTDPTVAGTDINVAIELRDAFGNLVSTGAASSANVTLTKSAGSGTLGGTLVKALSGGTVSFGAGESVDIDLIGSKTLNASDGTRNADSNAFTITHAPAASLAWTTQPTDPTVAGTDINVAIELRDAFGNLVSTGVDASANVTLTKSAGSGTLGGTLVKALSAGTVSFGAGESVDIDLIGSKTLNASDGTRNADSNAFTITHAPAASLAWTTQPTDPTVAGTDINVAIELRDTFGNLVSTGVDASANVTLTKSAGSGTLGGTLVKALSGGTVSFGAGESVDIDIIGSKTLNASDGTRNADSNAFTITHAPAASLAWTTQPTDPTVAGTDINVAIELRDTFGNLVSTGVDASANVTLTKSAGSGTLGGTLTKALSGGTVSFGAGESVDIDIIGSKTLNASDGTRNADSNAFTITHAPAASLAWTTQPTDPTVAGTDINVAIELRDAFGNLVSTGAAASANVTLTKSAGSGTLGGTLTKALSGGTVSFGAGESVDIDIIGSKTLNASDGTRNADSNAFTITHAPAASLAWTTQPTDPTVAGNDINVAIELRDAFGNLVSTGVDASANVTLTKSAGSGTLGGTLTKALSGGTVSFGAGESVDIDIIGSKTLNASDGTRNADSNAFTITHAPAASLAWTTQPTDPTVAGTDINVAIELRDAFGNLVSTGAAASANVTLSKSAGTGTLGGTLVKALSGGTVSFGAGESVDIDIIGSKTLNASDGTRNADSNAFTITHAPAASLAWTTQPTDPTVAGTDINVVIELRDTFGNLVSTGAASSANVTLTKSAGSGTLGGTLVKALSGGTVAFGAGESVDIDIIGSKTLNASDGTRNADSNAFTITHAPAASLAWTTQPTDPTVAGTDINVAIELRDAFGNLVSTGVDASANITLTKSAGSGTLGGTLTKALSGGTVSFGAGESVDIDIIGSKTLNASDGTRNADSNAFTITHAPAASLAWTTQPTDPTVAGTDINVAIELRDAFGNLVSTGVDASANVTLTKSAGSGTLGGTLVKALSAGTVSFGAAESVDINLIGSKTLNASDGTRNADSNAFTITHAPASQLAWTVQPTDPTVAGTLISPTIEIRDIFGNVVSTGADATASITISLQSGTGSLNGLATKAAVAGVAAFGGVEGLNIEEIGSKTLRASKTVMIQDSNAFTITHAAAASLAWTTQPTDPTVAGTDINVALELRDAFGNLVSTGVDSSANVTLTKSAGSGTLGGTLVKALSGGTVAFGAGESVDIDLIGSKTLNASDGTRNSDSNAFTITHAAANSLAWTTQPTDPTVAGTDINVAIELRDAFGNLVSTGVDASANVTLTKSAGSGSLGGTLTKALSSGTVSFGAGESVDIDLIGSKTLNASDGTRNADSNAFTITHAAAASLAWTTQPTDPTVAGTDINVALELRDAFGNLVSTGVDASANVTLTKSAGSGTLGGTLVKALSGGTVAFGAGESVDIDMIGSKTLNASDGTRNSDSNAFTITHAPAASLAWTTQPTDPTVAGTDINVAIELRDAFGNLVSTGVDSTANITLTKSAGTGTLGGTLVKALSGGTVSFGAGESVDIDLIGSKTLNASDGTRNADSNAFTITHAAAASLAWTTQPTDPTVAGADINVAIELRDTYGNLVSTGAAASANVTLTKSAGTGTLGGTLTKALSGGSVSFGAGESVDIDIIGSKSLNASDGTRNSDSNAFTITHAAPASLVWTTQPTDPTVAGADINVGIELRDTYGNLVSTGAAASANVTLTKSAGSGTLGGTLTKALSGGTVAFGAGESVDIDLIGSKTLNASDGTRNADSNAFTITHAAPASLTWTTQPTDPTIAGTDINVAIELRDAFGNLVSTGAEASANVTLTKSAGSGTLGGTLTKALSGGSVSFGAGESVDINLIGSKTLNASDGTRNADSNAFTITHAAPASLAWTTQPTDPTVAGADINVAIELRDTFGNLVSTGAAASANVTLSKSAGTGTLGGTLTKALSGGTVSFGAGESVDIDTIGSKTLNASDGTRNADSNAFTITHAAPASLAWTTQPTDPTVAGADINVAIELRDTYGNLVSTGAEASANVTLTKSAGTGILGGTLTKALSGGTVSFGAAESVDINLIGSKTLNASDGTRNADSNAFTITHAAANSLAWTTQPTDPTVAGTDINVAIELRDAFGNLVSTGAAASANVTLTKSAGSGTLGGTLTKALSGGTVSFGAGESVDIDLIGSKTLNASDGTRNADSNAFTINHAAASSLAWTVQPTDPTPAGDDILATIQVRDTFGNLVSTGLDAAANITLSKSAGTGSIFGTLTKAASGGVVSFGAVEGVYIDTVGLKTLQASKAATGETGIITQNSANFNISQATANKLVFTTQPANNTVAGNNLLPVIEIRDTFDNVITTGADASADVTLTLTSGTGAIFGTVTKAAVNGVATFTSGEAVYINLIGSKEITATKAVTIETGNIVRASDPFTIVHAAANSFAWTTQPTDPTVAGTDINVAIELRDAFGNLVSTGAASSANVTLTKSAGTGTLGGTLIKALSGGTVSFGAGESVDIDLIGSKTLNASDGTRNADSNAFTITHAAANSLAWTTQPTDPTVAGADINVALELRDTFGNLVSTGVDASANVTLTKSAGTGALGGTLVKALSGGTVSFGAAESVDINLIGSKTLNASDGTRNADSNAFTITHAAPASLAWTTQPTDPTVAGADINVAIELRDTYGNLVSTGAEASANVTLTKSAGAGTLGGTLVKALSGGTVSFGAGESVDIDLIGSKTLNASDGTRNADSNAFTITHAAPASLAWTTQPTDPTAAGADINVAIELRDTYGNLVSTGAEASANVTLTKSAGTGTLGGTLTKALSGGTVSFAAGESVDIDLIGSKTLNASDGTRNADSNAFTITHAAPASLAWTTQPTDPTVAGADINVALELRDSFGNLVSTGAEASANVTLTKSAGTGTLGGTLIKALSGGTVSFGAGESVDINLIGSKTLNASDGSRNADSNAFTITHAAPASLAWTTQPTDPTVAGADINVAIELRDTYGNLVSTGAEASANVTLSKSAGTGALGGTLIKALSGGTVSFGAGESVDINLIGSKTLNASDGTRNADSNAFTITHAAPASLAWTTQPTDPTVAGADINVAIELRDTYGNLVSTGAEASANVTLSKSAGTGALGGTLIKALSGGTVSFGAGESVDINLIGSKTLNASDGTRNADSNAFTITHAAPASLAWTTQPTDPTVAGADINVAIELRDTYGNLVSTGAEASANVTLSKSAGTGALGGTLIKALSGGTVSFGAGESVDINLIGSKTLNASDGTRNADSNAFTITHAAPASLAWTTQPTDPTVAGADISVAIELRDTFGNLVSTGAEASANVTLTKSAGTGTLGGTLIKPLSGGTVSFAAAEGVNIDLIGSKTLNADDGTRNADSNAFTIGHAPASSLVWTVQPSDPTIAGANITPTIVVRDSFGNLVSTGADATANITLSKQAGTGTLGGTLTKAAVGGSVSFGAGEAVNIDLIGSKTLRATKADTTGGGGTASFFTDSSAFTINHAAPNSLAWTTQPTDPTVAGADISVAIELRDTYGNLVSTGAEASANVTLTKSAGNGTLGGTLVKALSGGTVSFGAGESVDIDLIGSKTLNASDGTRNADSNAFTITHAAPASLAWTTQPTDPTVAGADINVALELRDTYGNLVSTGVEASANVTLTKSAGTGVLGGTLIKALSGGTVSFGAAESVDINLIGSKTLNASDGTRNADSNAFTITHAAPASLAWTTQPTDPTVAGADINVALELRDTYGNLVSTGAEASANVTLTKSAGTGTLGGTLIKAFSGGTVSFAAAESVDINLIGSKTLNASDGTRNADSNAFTITHAAPASLAWTTQPTDPTVAGADINVALELRDTYGNLVSTGAEASANVTLTKSAGTGTLGGTLIKALSGGTVSFAAAEGVNIDLIGSKTLNADDGTRNADSNAFTIGHAPASSLVWTVQPSDPTVAGANITPTIEVRDSFGNLVSTGADATANITLSKQAGTGTLGGTLVKAASGGSVSFGAGEAVNIDLVGSKTLRATKADTTGSGGTISFFTNSNAFTINHAPASQIVYTTSVTDPTAAGADIVPVLEIRDPYGNPVTTGADATANVTLSLQAGTGTLGGTLTKAAASGVATFTATEGVNIDLAGAKTLRATKADTTGGGGTVAAFVDDGFNISLPSAPTSITLFDPGSEPSNDTTPTFTVGGVSNGYTIKLYTNNTCTSGVIGSGVSGGASVNVTVAPPLTTGTYDIYATQTDTYTNESACTTVFYDDYDLDATPPNPATGGALASAWAASSATSPQFSWTASGSGDVDHYEVALGTSVGGTTATGGWVNPSDTSTTHIFTSLTLTECSGGTPVYYPSVRVHDTVGNISTELNYGSGFRWDNTNPGAPGVPDVSAGDAEATKSPTTTWTAGTDNCELSHYQMAIGTTSGGTDIQGFTNIGNVTSYQAVNGVGGFTLALSPGIYYYTTIRTVDSSGKVSSTQTSSQWRYIVAPDAVSDLAYASRTTTTVEMSWTAPNNNGTPITDYLIEYKETSSGTWLNFDDGVSAGTTATVTGLTASTSYDFRIRAYNGGTSGYSNTLTQQTAPNDPFFDPTVFKAMNLGGATDTNVVFFEDNTTWDYDGVPQTAANAGDVVNIATTAGKVITADKPFFVAGRLGSGGNTSKGNIAWNPPDWAGRDFQFNGTRNQEHVIGIWPFETGTITVDGPGNGSPGGALPQAYAATAGVYFEVRLDSNSGGFTMSSTNADFAAFQYSEDTGNNRVIDAMPILPPSNDYLGFPSNSGQFSTAKVGGTSGNYWRSDANTNTPISIPYGSMFSVSGNGSQYTSMAIRATAPDFFNVRSNADGDGNDSAPWMPKAMMRKRYAINAVAEWVAFTSDKPATIQVFVPGGGQSSFTLTKTGSDPMAPYYAYRTGDVAGTIFESNTRFAAWYEPNTDVGAALEDETIMFGNDGPGDLPVNFKLALWLDASDGNTLYQVDDCTSIATSTSDPIGCWRDKSYHGRNATQTAGNKPTLNTSVGTFSGKNGVVFDGGTSYLEFDQSFLNGTDYTVFAVVHRDNTSSDNYLMGTASAAANQGLHLGFSSNTAARVGQYANDLDATIDGQANNPTGIIWGRLDSTSGKKVYFNGVTNTDATTTQLSSTGQGVIGRGYSALGLTGKVAEIIVFTRALSDAEVDLMEEYLNKKWFNPNSISDFRLWLDGSDNNNVFSDAGCSTQTASGGNVLCWLDKSGNGYQALSASGTPLWQLDGSRNVVAFTNDSLQITAGGLGAVFDNGSTLDQVEVLAVMKSTNASEDGYLIHHPAGGDLSVQLPDASSNAYISVNGSGNGTLSAAWGGNTTNYFRWNFISDNSGGGPYQEIFRNNSSVTSDATADSISIALETFYIGDNGSATKFQNMNLGELFVFKRRLTADERTILRVHTDNKWDLP